MDESDPISMGENTDCIDLDAMKDLFGNQTEKAKAKRKKRSNVWSYFDMVPDSEKSDDNVGKPQAKCKLCGVTYMAASKYGTGNLKRHIDSCPRRNSRDIGQLLLQSDGLVSASKFDPAVFRDMLVALIVKHELPFRFVEYAGFRSLLQYLRPDCPQISRNTAKADMLKLYHQEKRRVKCMLDESPGRISLTSDLWTSLTTDGYMCITAHFLDKDWILQKRVLNFSFMPPPHNGISLSERTYALLCQWGIENKIFALTLDNASANDVSVDMLRTQMNIKGALVCNGDLFHLRCCAHILNLIVQDGLKECDCAIQKVRESVKYVKGSQIRKQKFLESCKFVDLDCKKGLRQDVPTRWNSTHLMLESVNYYRRAFSHLELTDSNFKQHCLSNNEWDRVDKIDKFLRVFYDATCDFSGTKYPTANLYFPAVFMIYSTLKEECESEDEFMRKMASQMIAKFEKYWSKFNVTSAIAVVLDPRYKLQLIEYAYTQIYGPCSLEYLNVETKLTSLFMEYSFSISTTSSTFSASTASTTSNQTKRILIEGFKSFQIITRSVNIRKNQLELYLDEPKIDILIDAPFDILSFWKGNEMRYPELACLARDILAIPVSTVASESTFSVSGRIIDQFRSSLKSDIVEALVCTRDWLYGQDAEKINLDDMIDDFMSSEIDKDNEGTSIPSTI